MFKAIIVFAFLLFLFVDEQMASSLEQFVNDDSDKDVVGYELIETSKQTGHTRYVLNATTLRWFDGTFT